MVAQSVLLAVEILQPVLFPAARCLLFETAFSCLLLDSPFRNDRDVSTMAAREAPRFLLHGRAIMNVESVFGIKRSLGRYLVSI
jgi:hypothetical protein